MGSASRHVTQRGAGSVQIRGLHLSPELQLGPLSSAHPTPTAYPGSAARVRPPLHLDLSCPCPAPGSPVLHAAGCTGRHTLPAAAHGGCGCPAAEEPRATSVWPDSEREDFAAGREAQTCPGSPAASVPSFCRQPGPRTLDCGLRHCGWGGECPTALSVTIPGGNEGLAAG